MEESEKQIHQKFVESGDKSQKDSFAVGSKFTGNGYTESGIDNEVPTPSQKEALPKTPSEEIRKTECKTSVVIKQENDEEPILKKPTEETTEGCQNSDQVIKGTKSKSCRCHLKQMKNFTSPTNKRKLSSMSDRSQDKGNPNENGEKGMDQKRQRLNPKHKSACQQPQNLPNLKKEDSPTDDKVDAKPKHNTGNNIGVYIECFCALLVNWIACHF